MWHGYLWISRDNSALSSCKQEQLDAGSSASIDRRPIQLKMQAILHNLTKCLIHPKSQSLFTVWLFFTPKVHSCPSSHTQSILYRTCVVCTSLAGTHLCCSLQVPVSPRAMGWLQWCPSRYYNYSHEKNDNNIYIRSGCPHIDFSMLVGENLKRMYCERRFRFWYRPRHLWIIKVETPFKAIVKPNYLKSLPCKSNCPSC